MKKFAAIFGLFLLAGCGGGSADAPAADAPIPTEATTIDGIGSLEIPETFYPQPAGQLPAGVVAAWSDLSRVGSSFTPAVAVSRESLPEEMTPLHFALLSLAGLEKTAGFSLRERTELELDGQKTLLLLFDAAPAGTPRTFLNLFFTRGTDGITVSAALPAEPDEAAVADFSRVVRSFLPEKK